MKYSYILFLVVTKDGVFVLDMAAKLDQVCLCSSSYCCRAAELTKMQLEHFFYLVRGVCLRARVGFCGQIFTTVWT